MLCQQAACKHRNGDDPLVRPWWSISFLGQQPNHSQVRRTWSSRHLFFGLGVNRTGSILVILHQNDSVSHWVRLRTAGTPSVHKPIITHQHRIEGIGASHTRAAGDSTHTLQDSSLIPSGADWAALQRNPTRAPCDSSMSHHTELLPKGPGRQSSEQQGSFRELSMDHCWNTAHTFQGQLGRCLAAPCRALESCTATTLGFFWTMCFHISNRRGNTKFMANCSYPYPSSSPPF